MIVSCTCDDGNVVFVLMKCEFPILLERLMTTWLENWFVLCDDDDDDVIFDIRSMVVVVVVFALLLDDGGDSP